MWTNSFHCVEKRRKVFPLCGKNDPFFPQCGKYFSIVWKNREKVFHTVENSAGRDSPAAADSRKNRLRDGFGFYGGGGALVVQRQQGGEEVVVAHGRIPTVGGEDGGVQFLVREIQPSRALVI